MSKLSRGVFFLVFLLVVGCGLAPKGKGPIFSPNPVPDGMSTVIHYRIERGCGSGAYYILILNGEPITIIGNGGYYIQHLNPSTYDYKEVLQARTWDMFAFAHMIDNTLAKAEPAYTLRTEPNTIYYLRWNACFEKKHIEEIPEEIAMKELNGLKAFEEIKLK